ncbi:MAG: hypothetical protein ACLQU3_32385 [Limisphaerales bacterium]
MRTLIYHPSFHHFDCNHFRSHDYLWHPGHQCAWGNVVNGVTFGRIGFHGGLGLFFFFAILVAILVFFLALGRSDRPADKGK